MQHPGRGRPHALHFAQLLFLRVQHPGETAKPLEQGVGYDIGVLAGVRQVKENFQRLVVGQALKALLGNALPHPFAVPLMEVVFCSHGSFSLSLDCCFYRTAFSAKDKPYPQNFLARARRALYYSCIKIKSTISSLKIKEPNS